MIRKYFPSLLFIAAAVLSQEVCAEEYSCDIRVPSLDEAEKECLRDNEYPWVKNGFSAFFCTGANADLWISYHVSKAATACHGLEDGKKHGAFLSFHLPEIGKTNLRVLTKGEYHRGKKTGKWITFDENGTKTREENFSDGEWHGKRARWYKNGRIREVYNYHHGTLHGKWETWHKNGQKMGEGYNSNGWPHGWETHWDQNGKVLRSGLMLDGLPYGAWEFNEPAGQGVCFFFKGRLYEDGQDPSCPYFKHPSGSTPGHPVYYPKDDSDFNLE